MVKYEKEFCKVCGIRIDKPLLFFKQVEGTEFRDGYMCDVCVKKR